MIVTTKQLYQVAYGKFAVGAYNVNNMEQILGLFRGNVQSQVKCTRAAEEWRPKVKATRKSISAPCEK